MGSLSGVHQEKAKTQDSWELVMKRPCSAPFPKKFPKALEQESRGRITKPTGRTASACEVESAQKRQLTVCDCWNPITLQSTQICERDGAQLVQLETLYHYVEHNSSTLSYPKTQTSLPQGAPRTLKPPPQPPKESSQRDGVARRMQLAELCLHCSGLQRKVVGWKGFRNGI